MQKQENKVCTDSTSIWWVPAKWKTHTVCLSIVLFFFITLGNARYNVVHYICACLLDFCLPLDHASSLRAGTSSLVYQDIPKLRTFRKHSKFSVNVVGKCASLPSSQPNVGRELNSVSVRGRESTEIRPWHVLRNKSCCNAPASQKEKHEVHSLCMIAK